MRKPKFMPLKPDRRLVCDVIEIARKMPTAPISCEIDVTELKRLRRLTTPRISWQVIMMRAYGLVSREVPELRQIYSPFPKPRIYQHSESVCLLTIARQFQGRERLFFARFCQPENHSLGQLQAMFDNYRKQPVGEIRQLKHQLRFSRMPWLIRKLGWTLLTHLMPASRARQMGTFGMSLASFRGARGSFHLGPCTTTLGYDQLCRKGKSYVTLTFDHRILDGKPAVDVLEQLANVLKNQVADELQMLTKRNSDTQIERNSRNEIRLFDPMSGIPFDQNGLESIPGSASRNGTDHANQAAA